MKLTLNQYRIYKDIEIELGKVKALTDLFFELGLEELPGGEPDTTIAIVRDVPAQVSLVERQQELAWGTDDILTAP